ncbi:hypothetical protein PBY51_001994 [Eleginops maclovinus]|uniref:Uncharacterized protein n=1 Tax=Eleginops maclovinus TaxID=56733 RepID=A0AAN7X0U8_ELEMC|nr:hypothetical protein PBY51_001994 [Eleginops maclovinus]
MQMWNQRASVMVYPLVCESTVSSPHPPFTCTALLAFHVPHPNPPPPPFPLCRPPLFPAQSPSPHQRQELQHPCWALPVYLFRSSHD